MLETPSFKSALSISLNVEVAHSMLLCVSVGIDHIRLRGKTAREDVNVVCY